ncbi:MAG: peptidoglycan DD-metalloendopeptidase family protein [Gallionella sp.]
MLTQNLLGQDRKRKLRWFVALSSMPLLGVLTAFGLVPQSDLELATTKISVEEIDLPQVEIVNSLPTYWRSDKVQHGDTVDSLLSRLGISDPAASQYLHIDADAKSFRELKAGEEVRAEVSEKGTAIRLDYLKNSKEKVQIDRRGELFGVSIQPAQFEKRLFVRSGEIRTNLYAAADEAGMPNSIANQLLELFSGDIDFHHDLREGDKFTAQYEMFYSDGELIGAGRILSAEFINQKRSYQAIYFQKSGQRSDYYTPEGQNVRKAFLRSPIAYSRVSSGFSNSRFHPILKKWRSHKGTDFAAPIGTEVRSTAEGVIDFVGSEGGYGKVIKINHQGRYTTVYGHLSRFTRGLHTGQRVSQGDTIGYVGMTGLTTGPHLHYEFRVDGQQRNPMQVALPDAKPIDEANRAAFQSVARELTAQFNLVRNISLAQLD